MREQTERTIEANSINAIAWLRRSARIVLQGVIADGAKLSLELSGGSGAGNNGGSAMRLRVRARAIVEGMLQRTPEELPKPLLAFARAYTTGGLPQQVKQLFKSERKELGLRVSARDGSVHTTSAFQRRALLLNQLCARLLVLRLTLKPTENGVGSGTRRAAAVDRNLRALGAVLFASSKVICYKVTPPLTPIPIHTNTQPLPNAAACRTHCGARMRVCKYL
ncbi:hypothetical protein T492DRAFT_247612 [Pavlovales sp. CCMP2436]|nr:hypothetical protein T492DRAFT_247612 [Pavlovales sp. CCMP2436]